MRLGRDREVFFKRFNPIRRAEHLLVVITFMALVLTGLPQKFHNQQWALYLVNLVGGVNEMRNLHRIVGLIFSAQFALHMLAAFWALLVRRISPSMAPTMKDVRDAIQSFKYNLRLTDQHPQYDRYEYKQKFEYWGMVVGGMVMIGTGFILWFPIILSSVLPAELIPISRVAHSNEAFLAFMVIIFWHLYGAHLSPEVFPGDSSIFTGKISEERMKHEHPLEYERMLKEKGKAEDA